MKVVTIQSNINIVVTNGLQFEDLTPQDSDIPNRFRIKSRIKHIQIKKGQHQYPAEIAKWSTVKALEKDKLLSVVGEMIIDDAKEKAEEEAKKKKKLIDSIPEVKSLGDVAGDK